MQSKLTGGNTTLIFTAEVLKKYPVKFYRCNQTGFIQTEEPFWLEDAYSSSITKLDVGLPYRNINLSNTVDKLLIKHFNYKGRFLDYGGGYGLFTRLMRDKGFNFYTTDKYCQNIFAEYFDLTDLPAGTIFEAVTAFEVLEHLTDPLAEIKQILQFADNLIFTTELPPPNIKAVTDWPYFSTETGQHVSFYTMASLQYIADKLGYNFYTDGAFLHLFTKKAFNKNPLQRGKENFFLRKARKLVNKADQPACGQVESLLLADWKFVKDKMNG